MMDSLRGQDEIGSDDAYDNGAIEAPPIFSSEERRMHVRAYNYWVSLLGPRALPSIEDLNPEEMEDFSPNSVLLDFSMGMENPAIIYLGSALREECGITGTVERVDDVPARSLLTRLTDHYLQIIANSAPVGFEAEFINQRDAEIMYRGILMPFSSDDETIDFIYGVINWKEVASQSMSDALDLEMKAAIASRPINALPSSIWADGPSATADYDEDEYSKTPQDIASMDASDFGFESADEPMAHTSTKAEADIYELEISDLATDDIGIDELDLSDFMAGCSVERPEDVVQFSQEQREDSAVDESVAQREQIDGIIKAAEQTDVANSIEEDALDLGTAGLGAIENTGDVYLPDLDEQEEETLEKESAGAIAHLRAVAAEASLSAPAITDVLDLTEQVGDLASTLDIARQSATEARDADARGRTTLYRAIGHAYDFALTARQAPDDYDALLASAGISVQARSPMTAVVKLVFGAEYDKTRIAEYALALEYGLSQGLPRGSLARQIGFYKGGLKGIVEDERARRKGAEAPKGPRGLERAYRRISKAKRLDAGSLTFNEHGVALVIARRESDGSVSFIASVDTQDKAAQKLLIAASRKI
jgi:hypothetical protein